MSVLAWPSTIPGLRISISRAPSYAVSTVMTQSRKRLSSTWESYPLYTYSLDFELLRSSPTLREFQQLFGHYARHFGGLDSFLFTDPDDSSATDCGFAVCDSVTTGFQLQRSLLGNVIDASGTSYIPQTKPYTNLLFNSSFETDSNADGLADTWAVTNGSSATEPNTSSIIPGMNGGKAQRVSWGTNNTTTKGLQQATGFVAGQWYTVSGFARASGSNVGKFVGFNSGGAAPSQTIAVAVPALSSVWQRFVIQVFWNVGVTPSALTILSISNASNGTVSTAATFGDLDFDLTQVSTGQFGVSDLQPIETPAAAAATRTPAYWPAVTDGFEPVLELNGDSTIYQDGDWPGRRVLFPFPRTNLMAFSEQFDNAAWTKTNITVTANSTAAPDGTTTADTLNEGVINSSHVVAQAPTAAEATGELRCYSVFVKASNLPNINVLVAGADFIGINVDLSAGTIPGSAGMTAPLASGIQTSPLWPGWLRVWFVKRVAALTGALRLQATADATYVVTSYTGTGRQFFAWGAMCERVSNLLGPTPYIKTPSSTAVTTTDYTLTSAGAVTFPAAPPSGSFLSWDGSYYRRVRFDVSSIDASRIVQTFWEARSIRLVSVKP